MRARPSFAKWASAGWLLSVTFAAASCHGPKVPRHAASAPPDAGAPSAPSAAPPDASATVREATAAPATSPPRERVCAMPVAPAAAKGDPKPFSAAEPRCRESDAFCDYVDAPPDPKDTCFVANENLRRAERESRGRARAPARASAAWDKRTSPRYFDRVDAHLHLDARESALLRKNGFVVLDRLGYASYAVAYHDVFQQQLPVYVGVDAVLNAVFQASQMLLEEVESKRLGPKLVAMIDRMRATLRASRTAYGEETADDLDVYLTVAHRLLHAGSDSKPRNVALESLVDGVVQHALDGSLLTPVDIFGRERMIDFTQYTPRGHYANDGWGAGIEVKDASAARAGGSSDPAPAERISLDRYFRAMTWLSRFEWNLVSRSCRSSQPGEAPDPTETPREARDALALADLVERSGSLDDLRAFEGVYSVFAGRREDVSVPDLLALARTNRIAPSSKDAPDRLKAAIGDRFQRTARTHFMPEGSSVLPAIATLFGPRIAPDVAPLTRLVHDSVPGRDDLGAADVAYVLGHDRAKTHLASSIAAHPALEAALDASRAELRASARGKGDVYSAWLSAVTRTAETPAGALPSYTKTEAWADLRMSSAIAGYAQIRHTFVLLAGQGYDAYGCEIPDGWVEPAIGVYDGLLAWSRAARAAVPHRAAYFRRVDEVLGMLRAISETELSGAALSEPQRRWLGMVAEHLPRGGYGGDSGEPPKYTGWYFDLFPDREKGAERGVDVVADYFTLTNADQVKYVGVEKAALGVFVVDVGGEPRAMVGPVVVPYETSTKIEARLDDEAARKTKEGKVAPWTSSYLAKEAPSPPLSAVLYACDDDMRVLVESPDDLGEVSVTLLDHHADAITEAQAHRVAAGTPTVFAFALRDAPDPPRDEASPFVTGRRRAAAVEGLHVRVHDRPGGGGRWDGTYTGSVYTWADSIARRRSEHGIGVTTLPQPATE